MKRNLILMTVVFLIAILASSCKKEETESCKCGEVVDVYVMTFKPFKGKDGIKFKGDEKLTVKNNCSGTEKAFNE